MAADRITEDDAGNLVISRPLMDEIQGLRSDVASGNATIVAKLEGKADKADMARMETRLDEHGRQISELQQWRHDKEVVGGIHQQHDQQRFTTRQKFWGVVGAAALVVATVIGPVIGTVIAGH